MSTIDTALAAETPSENQAQFTTTLSPGPDAGDTPIIRPKPQSTDEVLREAGFDLSVLEHAPGLESTNREAASEPAPAPDYKPHPATRLIPPPDEEQYRQLRDDIAKHGLLVPIELLDGLVIDGLSRLRACGELAIKPKTIDITTDSPVNHVVSKNVRRRHLDANQRAKIAVELLPAFEEEAKERQRAAGGDHRDPLPDASSGTAYEREATTQAAKAAGAGITATKTLASVKEKAPDVYEELAGVPGVPVAAVERAARLPKEARPEAIEAAKAARGKRPSKGKAKKPPKETKVNEGFTFSLRLPGKITVELNGEKVAISVKLSSKNTVMLDVPESVFKVTCRASPV